MLVGKTWENAFVVAWRKSLRGSLHSFSWMVNLPNNLTPLKSVSLKTKLSVMDLHRLVSDIRRRVEHEITFEGTERRIK